MTDCEVCASARARREQRIRRRYVQRIDIALQLDGICQTFNSERGVSHSMRAGIEQAMCSSQQHRGTNERVSASSIERLARLVRSDPDGGNDQRVPVGGVDLDPIVE